MTTPSWHIRPYRAGDERALVALWTEAFGRPMTEEHWRWKAKGRSASVENVGIAVSADDRPIFQFLGIPCPAVIAGVPRTVMVGADVVTAPAFRRLGVFRDTAAQLLDSWRAAGVALVLGLANATGASLRRAPGCERPFTLRWLVRPLRPERVLARRTGVAALARWRGLGTLWNRAWGAAERAGAGSEIVMRPLAGAAPEIDAVWERAREHVVNTLVRDRSWVAWRYSSFPGRSYQLTLASRAHVPAGYAVHRVVRHEDRTVVQIPEVFAPGDRGVYRALVNEVVRRAAAEDADTVVTLATPGSDAHRDLRRAGFLFGTGGWPVEVTRLDSTIPAAALRDPGSWWLVGGDFDVI